MLSKDEEQLIKNYIKDREQSKKYFQDMINLIDEHISKCNKVLNED